MASAFAYKHYKRDDTLVVNKEKHKQHEDLAEEEQAYDANDMIR